MLKLTTDKHEASCGLSATAELLVWLDQWSGPKCTGDETHDTVELSCCLDQWSGPKCTGDETHDSDTVELSCVSVIEHSSQCTLC